MSDKPSGAGVGTARTANYTPSPIERLTTSSVEQRVLATLERIERLLLDRFDPAVAADAPPLEDLITDVKPTSTPFTSRLRGKGKTK